MNRNMTIEEKRAIIVVTADASLTDSLACLIFFWPIVVSDNWRNPLVTPNMGMIKTSEVG